MDSNNPFAVSADRPVLQLCPPRHQALCSYLQHTPHLEKHDHWFAVPVLHSQMSSVCDLLRCHRPLPLLEQLRIMQPGRQQTLPLQDKQHATASLLQTVAGQKQLLKGKQDDLCSRNILLMLQGAQAPVPAWLLLLGVLQAATAPIAAGVLLLLLLVLSQQLMLLPTQPEAAAAATPPSASARHTQHLQDRPKGCQRSWVRHPYGSSW